MKRKIYKAYALMGRDGTFIAAFRFKPKRVRQGEKSYRYYVWTDCNGPKDGPLKNYASNIIEGSMNAHCIQVEITMKKI